MKLAVVALGGNAILRDHENGTIFDQERNTSYTLKNLMFLLKENYNLIITHGNGPQVGNILLRNDAGFNMYGIAPMPLDVCVAYTQGGIGYIIERVFRNILIENGINRDILTIGGQVLVDENDPAFNNPSKRIGKVYNEAEAQMLKREKGWIFKTSPKHKNGWRRVVPSPTPLKIFNISTIERIARGGSIVVTLGGGGVPVYRDKNNMIRTTDSVIDKDLASSLLASELGAEELYILTDVPFVYENYGKPDQKELEFLNLSDTKKLLEQGVFGEGNMAPKIMAAIDFIQRGGQKAIITEATKLEDKSYGTKITLEYDDRDIRPPS